MDAIGDWVRDQFGALDGDLMIRNGRVVGFRIGTGFPFLPTWAWIGLIVLAVLALRR